MPSNLKIIVQRKVVLWYVLIKSAKNGQTLLVSEIYYSRSNAARAAKKLSEALKVPWALQ